MKTNAHGYAIGDPCRCHDAKCRITMFPAQVRTEKRDALGTITFPLVTVEILMGVTCGARYGRAF